VVVFDFFLVGFFFLFVCFLQDLMKLYLVISSDKKERSG